MARGGGDEEALVARLERLGLAGQPGDNGDTGAAKENRPPAGGAAALYAVLQPYYAAHAPGVKSDAQVRAIAGKYAGRETALFERLESKYGQRVERAAARGVRAGPPAGDSGDAGAGAAVESVDPEAVMFRDGCTAAKAAARAGSLSQAVALYRGALLHTSDAALMAKVHRRIRKIRAKQATLKPQGNGFTWDTAADT